MSVKSKGLRVVLFTISVAVTLFSQAKESSTPEGLEYCTVCHGSQLKGNVNIGAPRLSGLPQWYIERQLLNFKHGLRGAHAEDTTGGEMRPMVWNLSEEELKKIAIWVATTDSPQPLITLNADPKVGKKLYQSCIACHGANAEGNELLGAPSLRGLNDWYLQTQLNHFRQGIRGSNSQDIYGQQMKAVSGVLTSDQDAANIAAYITQLSQ